MKGYKLFISLFFVALFSCSNSNKWAEFDEWYANHIEEYTHSKSVGDLVYTVSYQPSEVMTLKEVGENWDQADSVHQFYKNGMQFYLEIKPQNENRLWTAEKMLSIESKLRDRTDLFSLKVKNQKIEPLSVIVERGNELANRIVVLLNFQEVEEREFTLLMKDELNEYLTLKFNFEIPLQPQI